MALALPIDPHIPEILKKVSTHSTVIIKAPPGTGKSTRVPLALSRQSAKKILVLEPRRLAAKILAQFVSAEINEPVGQTVGYQFRNESKLSEKTRLQFVTEGLLLRYMISDPTLKGVGVVILDEFHERHIHTDIALLTLTRLQQTTRPDLKLVIMSATLSTEKLENYLKGTAILHEVSMPANTVTLRYLQAEKKTSRPKFLEDKVLEAIASFETNSKEEGHILVFLPGMAEIRRAENHLESRLQKNRYLILPLHGSLPSADQDRVFQKSDKTKIILSTNIAESSLTIPGVNRVIDAGLEKKLYYSWWSGSPELVTENISQASAIQRAGRAGRERAGEVIRLYTKSDYETFKPFSPPEITRSDLSHVILELLSLGFEQPDKINWMDAPPEKALASAIETLLLLEAIINTQTGFKMTAIGYECVKAPVHPRLARVLIEAHSLGIGAEASRLCAWLDRKTNSRTDILESSLNDTGVFKTDFELKKLASTLEHLYKNGKAATNPKEALVLSLLKGFPDHVGKIKNSDKKDETALLLAKGGRAWAKQELLTPPHEYYLVLETIESVTTKNTTDNLKATQIIPIAEELLLSVGSFPLKEETTLTWNEARGKAERKSSLLYGQIELESSVGQTDKLNEAEKKSLASLVLSQGLKLEKRSIHDFIEAARLKGFDHESLETDLARLILLKKHHPSLFEKSDLNKMDDDFGNYLEKIFEDQWDLNLLKTEGAFLEKNLSRLDYQARTQLEKELPSFIVSDFVNPKTGKKRKIKITYKISQDPWCESFLQDFIGIKQTPKILSGKVPLTIKLWAPNKRPIQVTSDLKSFWEKTYPELKPQLSRRYPRQVWP